MNVENIANAAFFVLPACFIFSVGFVVGAYWATMKN